MLHLLEGPVLRHISEDKRRKNQHPAGIKPTTSLLRGVHSTAVLPPLPNQLNYLDFFPDFLVGTKANGFHQVFTIP